MKPIVDKAAKTSSGVDLIKDRSGTSGGVFEFFNILIFCFGWSIPVVRSYVRMH